MTARYIVGDVREVLATFEDGSVDLILTSPPFLALRSYLPADHPDKAKEIGSEPDPGTFIDALLELTEEFGRVLAPHGSLCVELGDTYAGGGQGPDPGKYAAKDDVVTVAATRGAGWPLAKSLCMVPQSYAWALAYGRNPHTGRTTPPWRVRNIVRWCRPNPPVGALGDKYRPATSEMVVACKSASRWFDLDAVREPGSSNTHARTAKGVESRPNTGKSADDERRGGNFSTLDVLHETAGAPPLDWWAIPTQGYAGSHYATFPSALCVRPILSMCPQRVCRTCGEPSRRIAETVNAVGKAVQRTAHRESPDGAGDGRVGVMDVNDAPDYSERVTLGWTDCGHDNWRTGIVLDPFAGSGTTLAVATGHGRHAIGIDLDARNAELALERVGPLLLTVEKMST